MTSFKIGQLHDSNVTPPKPQTRVIKMHPNINTNGIQVGFVCLCLDGSLWNFDARFKTWELLTKFDKGEYL